MSQSAIEAMIEQLEVKTFDELIKLYPNVKKNCDNQEKLYMEVENNLKLKSREIDKYKLEINRMNKDKEKYIADNFASLKEDRIRKSLSSYEIHLKKIRDEIKEEYERTKELCKSNEVVDSSLNRDIEDLIKLYKELRVWMRECSASEYLMRYMQTVQVPADRFGKSLDDLVGRKKYFEDMHGRLQQFMDKTPVGFSPVEVEYRRGANINLRAFAGAGGLASVIIGSLFFPVIAPVSLIGVCGFAGYLAHTNRNNIEDLQDIAEFVKFMQQNEKALIGVINNSNITYIKLRNKKIKEEYAKKYNKAKGEIERIEKEYKIAKAKELEAFDDDAFRKELSINFENKIKEYRIAVQDGEKNIQTLERSVVQAKGAYAEAKDYREALASVIEEASKRPRKARMWYMPDKLFYKFDSKNNMFGIEFSGHSLAYIYKPMEELPRFNDYRRNTELYINELRQDLPTAKSYKEYQESSATRHLLTIVMQLICNIYSKALHIYIVDKKNAGSEFMALLKIPNISIISSNSTVTESTAEGLGLGDLTDELDKELKDRQAILVESGCKTIKEYNIKQKENGSKPMEYKVVIFYKYDQSDLQTSSFLQMIQNSEYLGLIPIYFMDYNEVIGKYEQIYQQFQLTKSKPKEIPNARQYLDVLNSFRDKRFVIYANDAFNSERQFKFKQSPILDKHITKDVLVKDGYYYMYAAQCANFWSSIINTLCKS